MSGGPPPVRVVGTAGHVDHGKSTLVTALTGMDPDRLSEERERGMTIDLGFAWLVTPSGLEIGFVDVPGHQDFIRNMLAGVGGIDAVLLVVAADEGVRPQTREHLAILDLLGVGHGVVAITKRDLVDDAWADLVRAEVRGILAGTPLEGAAIVEVAAPAGRGLAELVAALEHVLARTPPRRGLGRPRLPIDRSFTMPGFGTVVTGTLVDGSLQVGDEVEIAPAGAHARIRGLQTHRRARDAADPGARVAVNLAGVEKDAVTRGMVLARPGSLPSTAAIAMRLRTLPGTSAPLAHGEELKVHAGTAEVMARLHLLEGGELAPGEVGWVELRLAEPLAVAIGDRVVVRRPSPSETVGGGEVIETAVPRARRRAEQVAALERRMSPSPGARLLAVLDVPRTAHEAGERSGLPPEERDAAIAAALASGDAVRLGDALLSREAFEALTRRALEVCARAHERTPLRAGAPREEVRGAVGLEPKRFLAFVERLVADGRLADRVTALALPGHVPRLPPEVESRWAAARTALARDLTHAPSPAQLATEHGIDREALVALAERGDLVRVGADAVFLPDAVVRFADAVIAELAAARTITVARARDLTGSSRRHVLPLLQYLDDHGVTRRQGDDRILVLAPDAARARVRSLTHGEVQK